MIFNGLSLKQLLKSLVGPDVFRTFAPVNGKVTDIPETLLTMTEEMRLMRETIDSQHAGIFRLTRLVESNHVGLRKRDKRIEELEAKLAKYEASDKKSGNSSTPPSKESMKAEAVLRTKILHKPTGRKPGGQKGHEGSTMKMTQTLQYVK